MSICAEAKRLGQYTVKITHCAKKQRKATCRWTFPTIMRLSSLVREKGVEPSLRWNWCLKPARLPFRHSRAECKNNSHSVPSSRGKVNSHPAKSCRKSVSAVALRRAGIRASGTSTGCPSAQSSIPPCSRCTRSRCNRAFPPARQNWWGSNQC